MKEVIDKHTIKVQNRVMVGKWINQEDLLKELGLED
jgi:hypothetical protein